MSDLMAVAVLIAIPLVGIMFSIERLVKTISSGEVRIQNHIRITVSYPKDMNVTLEKK